MYVVAMSNSHNNLLKETERNDFNGDVLWCFALRQGDLQTVLQGSLDDAYKELATIDCERYTGP